MKNSYEVVDWSNVKIKTYDSDFDLFEFRSLISEKVRIDCLMNVSLFSDFIKLDDGIEYKIIKMLTK